MSFTDMLPCYKQACETLEQFTEELDLEKYHDIYDISSSDHDDAMLGYNADEFDDFDSLRVLKILAARFHIMRKILLCCLMALEAKSGGPDFQRWSTAVDTIRGVTAVTGTAEDRLRRILVEEESK